MLKTTKEFDFVYKNSFKFRTSELDICVLKPNLTEQFYMKFRRMPCNLVGFSVSKKIGIAIKRNLIKRRLRTICREFFGESLKQRISQKVHKGHINHKDSHTNLSKSKNLICIFIAKGQIAQMPFSVLKESVFTTLKKQIRFMKNNALPVRANHPRKSYKLHQSNKVQAETQGNTNENR